MTYYCPRCRRPTLVVEVVSIGQGVEERFLTCRECGFAVWVGVLEQLHTCVTPEDVARLAKVHPHIASMLKKMLGRKLRFVKKFNIVTGREVLCLEPVNMRDSEALSIIRRIEALLHR